MWRVMHWTILIVALLLLPRTMDAQTIHKDDLKYFRGMIPYEDLLHMRDTLQIASFYDWEIVRPDTVLHNPDAPDSSVQVFSWFLNRLDQQSFNPYFPYYPSYRGYSDPIDYHRDYHIYILSHTDDMSVAVNHGLLTRWEEVGDSLRFLCGSTDTRDLGWVGLAAVKRVVPFPDSSLLVVIEHFVESLDGMVINGRYTFLRVTEQCHYETVHWSGRRHTYGYRTSRPSVHLFSSFDNLVPGAYRITLVTEWSSDTTDFPRIFRGTLDSVTTEVVDLWQLAVEKCSIDTTVLDQ